MVDMEFDLNEFSKEDLINFIHYAHKNNYTINEAIVEAMKGAIKDHEYQNK